MGLTRIAYACMCDRPSPANIHDLPTHPASGCATARRRFLFLSHRFVVHGDKLPSIRAVGTKFHPPGADNHSMSETHIILIGGGGHAKVVLDAAQCAGIELHGFVDDDPDAPITKQRRCPAFVGSIDDVTNRTGCRPMLAVGNLALRARLIEQLGDVDFAMPMVHPSAVVAPSAMVALGVFVGAGAIINADAKVCGHAIINTGAIIEHDVRVGINTHIAPGAVLGGGVHVGDHTLIGIGATVLPGVKIGSGSVVGGGAVVVEDVEDGATVVGVPARVIGVGV